MKISNYYKINPYIHYSNCHEDAGMILKIANNPKTILSIASAGDNSFTCLLLNPEKVVSIDTNITQVYLVELKKTAIKYLSYEEFLIFLGIKEGNSVDQYNKLTIYLTKEVKEYFDLHMYLIEEIKLVNCGRFEYYFNLFSKKVLPLIHNEKTINSFMEQENLEKQKDFYNRKFNNFRFKLMFKLFFSKVVMKKLGRDKDYFKYNKGSLSKELKERFELGIYHNLNKDNPYLQYVIYNKFNTLPLYLRKENFEIIKENIDKLEIKNISLIDELNKENKYDLMNLSDVFEYLSNDLMKMYEELINNCLNDKGRIIFWNMQNKREFKEKFKRLNVSLKDDLAFYYKDLLVYEKE